MVKEIESYISEVRAFTTHSAAELEEFRIRWAGKKGIINDLFEKFRQVPNELKKGNRPHP